QSLVVNASAYRALTLICGETFCQNSEARDLGERLVSFVRASQRDDGSWPYALESKGDDFVDHFHTCFVLKNLAKIHTVTADDKAWDAVKKGFAYYETALFDDRGLPKPFAEGGSRLLKYNLYDFAETINLGVLLRERIPGAFEKALFVARETVERFQLPD